MTGRLLLSVLSHMILPRRKWPIWGPLFSKWWYTVKISFGGLTHRQRWNRICKVSLLHETRQMLMLMLLIVEFEASPTQQLLLKEGIETIEHEKSPSRKFHAYFCFSFPCLLSFHTFSHAVYINWVLHRLSFSLFPSQRSLKREHLIIKWILRITHLDKDMSIDFADWIRDGTVLSS